MLKKASLTFLFVVTLLTAVLAQKKSVEFGPFVGRSYYIGELNPKKQLGGGVGQLSYGALFRWNLNPRYSWRFSLFRAKVAAEDEVEDLLFNQFRNASFEGNITEFSTQIEFNFLPYQMGDKKYFFAPYLFAGLSAFSIESTARIENFETLPAPSNGGINFAFPFGLGFKFNIGKRLTLSTEWGFRKTSIDTIDDLPNEFEELFELGKSYDNDWFVISGFALTYKLNKQGPCPAIER